MFSIQEYDNFFDKDRNGILDHINHFAETCLDLLKFNFKQDEEYFHFTVILPRTITDLKEEFQNQKTFYTESLPLCIAEKYQYCNILIRNRFKYPSYYNRYKIKALDYQSIEDVMFKIKDDASFWKRKYIRDE